MAIPQEKIRRLYTAEEYLESERAAEYRHEFLDGQIFAMAGESLSHSRICANLLGEARAKLKGKPCEALSPNMKIRTSSACLFAYPDLTIFCGKPQFHDVKKDVLTNPQVIFEVLSPSTEIYDRTTKFQRYRMGNDTLTDYVLVSQDKTFVEHFTKQADGDWLYRSFSEMTDVLRIETVDCDLSLSEIYDRVEFPPEQSTEEVEREI
jgi:Uma2 family endonuclease